MCCSFYNQKVFQHLTVVSSDSQNAICTFYQRNMWSPLANACKCQCHTSYETSSIEALGNGHPRGWEHICHVNLACNTRVTEVPAANVDPGPTLDRHYSNVVSNVGRGRHCSDTAPTLDADVGQGQH